MQKNMAKMWILSAFICINIHLSIGITTGPAASYITAPGKLIPGLLTPKSFQYATNISLNECAAKCTLDFHLKQFPCYAFEYATRSRMCVMSNTTTLVIRRGYLGLQDNEVMQYYERPKGSYINLFKRTPHRVVNNAKSYFADFPNISAERCALFCLMETRDTCMSFSYSTEGKTCRLSKTYYSEHNGQRLIHSDSFDHYQYFTTWPCNVTIPWNYTPRAIASPFFPYASVKDVNCYVKIEAPLGKQVDMQFTTFFLKDNICTGPEMGVSVIDGATSRDTLLKKVCDSDTFVDRRFQSSSGYLYLKFATGSSPLVFKAVYGFSVPDPCHPSPCQNGGTCQSRSGNYTCACPAGYTGSRCETEINACSSNPCFFGGKCTNHGAGFQCECPEILAGLRCQRFIGLCHTSPCKNGGLCTPRGRDRYNCACPNTFTGQNCTEEVPTDPCDDQPCGNGGTCTSGGSGNKEVTCACALGFTGNMCETNINDCASSPCFFNVKCTDLINDFSCECPSILTGKRCDVFLGRCAENPCAHGNCKPEGRNNYTCECDAGFKGENCDVTAFNFCQPNPCNHGTCASFDNGPSCTCDFNYGGALCDERINHCKGVDCNHGECHDLEEGFTCQCITGYEGQYCDQTIDHCLTADCGDGVCINKLTGHFCACNDGTTGQKCESGHSLDNCHNHACANGTCIAAHDGYTCVCFEHYTGQFCDAPVDYCRINPCENGRCEGRVDGYECDCDENYQGTNCGEKIDYCKDNKCVYGLCQPLANDYDCICAVGFHGNHCQYREGEGAQPTSASTTTAISTTAGDPCSPSPCQHGGLCLPAGEGFHCLCVRGWKGQSCETSDRCKENTCMNGTCVATETSFRCELPAVVGMGHTAKAVGTPLTDANTTTTIAPPHVRSDIRCEADAIAIFLPGSVFPAGHNITWREERCTVTYNGSHYVDTVRLNDCGTTVHIDTDTVTFYNELTVHRGTHGRSPGNNDITYGDDHETVIPVKCIYPRQSNVSTSYEPVKQHAHFIEKRYGDLDIAMLQYETEQFRTPVPTTSYPRSVPLNDDIFIRIGLNFDTSDIGVKVDHCIATSTPSPADIQWHSIIQSGCPSSHTRLLSASGHPDVRFAFKAFDFSHKTTSYIYVHCEVSVCDHANCTMGCPPRVRRAAADDTYGGARLVTAGPLFVEKRNAKENAGSAVSMTTVFAGLCLCVAMVAVVVAVIGWRRQSRK